MEWFFGFYFHFFYLSTQRNETYCKIKQQVLLLNTYKKKFFRGNNNTFIKNSSIQTHAHLLCRNLTGKNECLDTAQQKPTATHE